MVYSGISISVDQHTAMAKSVNSTDSKLKRINQFHRNKRVSNSPNHLNIPACERSRSAIIDVIILIAVITACGFLLYPCFIILAHKSVELGQEVVDVVIEEIIRAPLVFGCLGLSILFAAMALLTITLYTDNRCGKKGCRGLRKAAEFDIQLETDCVKNIEKSGLKKGLYELPRDHHRDLEAELKKLAPPNGRAVLVFRESCGCSVGRLEVPGPRKSRKANK